MRMIVAEFIIVAGLLLAQQVACGPLGEKNIIDEMELKDANGQEILASLCSDPTQRISRVSSIRWLSVNLDKSKEPSLAECKQQYLGPLQLLDEIIISQSNDICSLETVKKIDQFQWSYQMGAMNKRWMKFGEGSLPEPLKVLFMNYASEVTNLCRSQLTKNIGLAVAQKEASSDQDETASLDGDFGGLVDKLQQILIPFDKILRHENFVLLWDMLINHERKKNHDIRVHDPSSDDTIASLMKVKDAADVWKAQYTCRYILKPVYKDTVLPVMRLIDMGYDNKDKQLDDDMKDNLEERKWFKYAQTCELLLGLKFYEDKSMKGSDFGILKTLEEAKNFDTAPIPNQEELKKLPQIKTLPVSLSNDQLTIALHSDERKLLKLFRSNAEERGHLFRTIIRNVMGNALSKSFSGRNQIVTMFKKLKPSSKKPKDDAEVTKEALEETDQFLKESEKLDTDVATRKKRSLDLKSRVEQFLINLPIIIGAYMMRAIVSLQKKNEPVSN